MRSRLQFHSWIGYHHGFQWHLKLKVVSNNHTRTSWPTGQDLELAIEELRRSSCLEF